MEFLSSSTYTNSPDLAEHLRHVRNVDWASSSLGPLEIWPRELALLIHAMMIDPFPRTLVLGSEMLMLYNPAYGNLAGENHPRILGMPVLEAWPKTRDVTLRIKRLVDKTGRAHIEEAHPFLYPRSGRLEEVFLTWTSFPLAGSTPGYYVAFHNVTDLKVSEARKHLLRELSDQWKRAASSPVFWSTVTRSLAAHPNEFPFALLYSSNTAFSADGSCRVDPDAGDGHIFSLRGYVGNTSARSQIQECLTMDPAAHDSAFFAPIREAITTRKPVYMSVDQGSIPDAWRAAAAGRSNGEELHSAVILPVRSNRTAKVISIVFLGLNTRKAYDDASELWFSDIKRTLRECATFCLLADEEARKKRESDEQAAAEQVLLEKKLATREKEASHATGQFQRMMKMMEGCDVGIFEYDAKGVLQNATDSWFKLSGHPRDPAKYREVGFAGLVHDDDAELVMSMWNRLQAGQSVNFEMRWKNRDTHHPSEDSVDGQWVLSTCLPVFDSEGRFTGAAGCTTDIGAQKRVQKDTERRAAALERARASEQQATEVTERLRRMQRIIELIDVGIFEYNTDGSLIQANDAYFQLTGIPRDESGYLPFKYNDHVFEADRQALDERWKRLIAGVPETFELRFNAPNKEPGDEPSTWTLAACVPVMDGKGGVSSIYGCLTNIDLQKQAEQETLARAEALERARASEHRFARFTETATVAIFISELPSKAFTYCNQAFFDMTGLERTEPEKVDWRRVIHEDDLAEVDQAWYRCEAHQESINIQFRLKREWKGSNGEVLGSMWCMASAHPEYHEDGSMKGVMGTISDITGLKFAESVQRLRVEEAIEAKRQQENFIDMTSHEIRNPLGAVVHCADSLTESLEEITQVTNTLTLTTASDKAKVKQLHEQIDSSIDAINTIASCSAHQKRIVDDILVLSKLDSNLLQIAPSCIQVVDILRDVQRMFEAEAHRAGVTLTAEADPSLSALNIQWALLDTGRALQILINLVTNALKFTKNKDVRKVSILMGASKQRPSEKDLHVDFALANSIHDSIYEMADHGEDTFYLWFTVHDTGRGMTADEKARIFSRFAQGSPRTYSEYGGSGLGLFISRELAGLQGGEIGVASEAGTGSTFAFFIRTSRAAPPSPSKLEFGLSQSALSRPGADNMTRHDSGPGGEDVAVPERVSILIVEDNLLNQKVLKKQLAKHGYIVHTANNGAEALDVLRASSQWNKAHTAPDAALTALKPAATHLPSSTPPTPQDNISIILMDFEMPVMDGLTASRKIRELQRVGDVKGHIPIIGISANARAEQTSAALQAGMDDAVSKPFRVVDLIPKVERLAGWAARGAGA